MNINIMPASREEEIKQNVAMILATPTFSVPLDREFGVSTDITDRPIQVAQSLITSEIYEKIGRYELRAEIVSITFERDDKNGKLIPKVEVTDNGQ
ncbi:MAG: hypothetical protein FWD48_01245 [Oscillospiraceae bacterium]|nr:hypothetical protein [Oscillospiraceae bacterium]